MNTKHLFSGNTNKPDNPYHPHSISRRQFVQSGAVAAAAFTIAPRHILSGRGLAAPDKYQATWESLKTHQEPEWLDDAKFGIYFHWGVYSVPAFGNEWYSRNMYRPGSRENKHHIEKWGPLEKFGYKDFIPMFKAEKFDPDDWAKLFVDSGAKFAGPVAEHADGFSMWDSKFTNWNAAKMGPKRDVVGELEKAIRKQRLKFITTFHHQWLWAWYPTFDKGIDTGDPKYSGLYGPLVSEAAWNFKEKVSYPPEFCRLWENKIREVIDKYGPDLLWFDSRMGDIPEEYRMGFLAYYYNKAVDWKKDVAVTYKGSDLQIGTGILDLEKGRMAKTTTYKWVNDDVINWNSWSYVENADYKSADRLVDELVDIVSKNGSLLLDIDPRPDGTIPEPTRERLLQIGKWLKINGEAIYGTRPWEIFGEGPTKVIEGGFGESQIKDFTAADIRFTRKGNTLYAILLDWPAGSTKIESLKEGRSLWFGRIRSVKMLGIKKPLEWKQDANGLTVQIPVEKPCEHAFVLKISG
jgi:alpha-L-fucosidase